MVDSVIETEVSKYTLNSKEEAPFREGDQIVFRPQYGINFKLLRVDRVVSTKNCECTELPRIESLDHRNKELVTDSLCKELLGYLSIKTEPFNDVVVRIL